MTTGLLIAVHLAVMPPAGETAQPQPIPVTGRNCPELAAFDAMMTAFLAEHGIPGGALAVARQGRLVYARGFGYADMDAKQPVRPDALFRIASLSKPVTAVAVLQLVARGKLRLDDRVFDVLRERFPLPDDGSSDPRLKDVTIRHLLQHTGGWDRNESFDPMFRAVEFAEQLGVEPPAGSDSVIRAMATQPLDFPPGERFAYSNYGYCLLGRVIETVSGTGYEEYVRRQVLEPVGVTRMRIGRTLRCGRADGEVCYYSPDDPTGPAVVGARIGKPVPQPYGAWYLEAMDAHGGWIGSAVDLVRFASALDGDAPQPLLNHCRLEAMRARPEGRAGHEEDGTPKDVYYGCGWNVRPVGETGCHLWHTGSLPGTAALLVRRNDGLVWCVLLNSRATKDGEHPAKLLDPLLHQAAAAVEHWPDHDLFPPL